MPRCRNPDSLEKEPSPARRICIRLKILDGIFIARRNSLFKSAKLSRSVRAGNINIDPAAGPMVFLIAVLRPGVCQGRLRKAV
jgi:hypothetical protein